MSISLTVGSNPPISLANLTDLENTVKSDLSLGVEFDGQINRPISNLPAGLSSTAIQYTSGNQSWKLGDFTFTLSGGVTGKLSVVKSGDVLLSYTDGFATEMSTGLSTTTNANPTTSIKAPDGTVFICIELDFSIQGGVSGSFTQGIYGVTGSANTNDTFSIAFYKRCAPTDLLKDAIGAAFSGFVLPLHPQTLTNLQVGDYLHYDFNANLQLGLGASVGIDKVLYSGQYKADIPDTANAVAVNASVKAEVQAGAKLAFSFSYAGSFEALLWKDTANSGRLHLYRADKQDTTLGLNLGLTLTSDPTASASVMTSQLGSLLSGLLPGPLATAFNNVVWPKAASEISKYVTDANNKVAGWLKPLSQAQATLDFAIEQTNQNFLLLDYTFDLTAAAFAAGWSAAIGGKFLDALETPAGGVSIAIGSGLENFYDQKTSVSLNLFGKLTAAWSSAIISNSSLIYAGNNTFHLVADVGRTLLSSVNTSQKEIDFYFAAELDLSAAPQTLGTVNLHCTLEATKNGSFGAYIASFLRLTTTGPDNAALTKTVAANAARANTTQYLHLIFTPAAYGRLDYSAIPKSPGDDTTNDQTNYAAFARACSDLLPNPPANFSGAYQAMSSYHEWSNWNIACTNNWPAPNGAVPDRSQRWGNTGGGPATAELNGSFPGLPANLIGFTFEAETDFMDLCEALNNLATAVAVANIQDWENFVAYLKSIIKNLVSPDFIAPTALALTRLCAVGQPSLVVGPAPGLTDQTSIGVTMTYS